MKLKPVHIIRYFLQTVSLIVFGVLFTYLIYPLEGQASILKWFSRLDPWVFINQLRWQHTVSTWVWILLVTICTTLLLGRVFCGWLCPFGALMTLTDFIGRRIFANKSLKPTALFRNKVVQILLPFRYLWFFFLVITFIFGLNFAYSLTPFALFSQEIVKVYQHSIPWILIVIVVGTLLFSRVWCSIFCPTGILLSLLAKWRIVRFMTDGPCAHCKKCERVCPVGAAPDQSGVAGEGCLVCGACEAVCPPNSIRFQKKKFSVSKTQVQNKLGEENKVSDPQNEITRRQFIKIACVFIIGIAVSIWGRTTLMAKKVLRPPGALDEIRFRSVCNRCGRCIKVCPNNALQRMSLVEGIDVYATPFIIPREANCSLCMSCQEVCPTGAIAQIPVEQVKMGVATIDRTKCLAWSQGKLCYICGEQCLRVAIDIDESNRPTIQPDLCVGCGTCEKNCPVEGSAIRVTPK